MQCEYGDIPRYAGSDTYKRSFICPFVLATFKASSDSLGYELSDYKGQVDERCEQTSESQRADLGCVCWGNNHVESVCQAAEDFASAEHRKRCREELHKHEADGPHTAHSKRPSPPKSFHGIAAGKCSQDLADRVAHPQSSLPWSRDLVGAIDEISVPLLERREGVEGEDDLAIIA